MISFEPTQSKVFVQSFIDILKATISIQWNPWIFNETPKYFNYVQFW